MESLQTRTTTNALNHRSTSVALSLSLISLCFVQLTGTASNGAQLRNEYKVADASTSPLEGSAGRTTLQGGAGSTTLQGGAGSTMLQGGTGSTMLQGGAGSTMLQGGTGSTMLQGGTGSTLLQGGAGSTMLQTGTTGQLIRGNVEREAGPVNVLIVLDCSRSMKEKLDGEVKMVLAKNVLEQALHKIPADIHVGLRTFGQGVGGGMDCMSSYLLCPLGTHNRGSIAERVRSITPSGLTPIAYAIRQAAEDDFRGVQGPKTMILITDGADTCNGQPCEYIRTLPLRGIKLKVDVVGMDLKNDAAARSQLNCISSQSGGKYYDANSSADLLKSIQSSVDKAIEGKVIIHRGSNVQNGETPPELMPLHAMPAQTLPEHFASPSDEEPKPLPESEDTSNNTSTKKEPVKKAPALPTVPPASGSIRPVQN